MSNNIELIAPFPAHAIPRVWCWIEEFRNRVCDDFAPKTLDDFLADWERRDRAGRASWAVVKDGEIGGVIWATAVSPIVADIHAVFAKRFWGHDITLAAISQVCGQLFAAGATKVISWAFLDNHGVIGLWKKLGGAVEGRLAAHTMRAGKAVDMVLLGLRKEAYRVGSTKSAGHGSAGHQLQLREQHHESAPELSLATEQHQLGDAAIQPELNAVPTVAPSSSV